MADKKISQLNSASLPLAGTEVVPIVQGGETKKVAISELSGAVDSVNGQIGVVVLDADDVVAVPRGGTTVGNPIIGALQMADGTEIYSENSTKSSIFFEDGYLYIKFLNALSEESQFLLSDLGLSISSLTSGFRGLIGSDDFTPNITDLDYTQKIYVDSIMSNEDLSRAKRKDDTLYGILDQYTGENITLEKTTDTNTADGVIYFDLDGEKFKRNYIEYADVRWFGAKGDGVDLGIGNYSGDHDAINTALRICKKVILKDGVFIVKKPIVLNTENDLFIDVTATLKLGDASNCTLLKNSHVDIYKDANGIPTYPIGFVRHKNIKIHGKGRIDFNGWLQNRSDTTGGGVHDNPLVVGTPRFADGIGIGNYYVGWGCKFVDIDNFYFGGGLTTVNARTYTFSCSGLTNYIFEDIISERTYYVQNQDFLNIVGNMFDGIVRNISGVSGDEFVVISNNQLGDLTLRQGDVKRLLVENISYWGINPASTPEVQLPLSTFEDGFWSHRLARISYTKGFVVDDITIRNCYATNSKLHAQIVISKLPYSGGTFPDVYDGDGYIGKVTIDNICSSNAEGLIDFGDYTIVKDLIVNNIIDRRVGFGDPRGFIANYENFTGEVVDFTNSKIENLTLSNVKTILGGGTNPSQSWIKFAGEIKNLTIDNYNIVTEVGSESNVLWNLLESNVKTFWLSNSDFSQFNKIFDLSNNDCVFFENNCTYKAGKDLETQIFTRANTSTFVMDTDDIAIAVNGDVVRTSTGLKLFNGTFWQSFNKPPLTTNKIPVQGLNDLVDSDIIKNGDFEYDFGSTNKTSAINIHKSAGFFGDSTPFHRYWYDGFNMFKTWMDGNFNTVFESIQKGTEQSGIIFKTNGANILNLKKTGISEFFGRVKGLDATEINDFTTLGQENKRTGWASYKDTVYTGGSPFTIGNGVTSSIPNNAGTVINNQLPLGVTSFYNSGTGKITPELVGDYYITTIRLKATTTAVMGGHADFGIDIGGALGIIFKETVIFAKGAGIEHNFVFICTGYTAATFVANGGIPKLTALGGGDVKIYDIEFQIDRTHRAI